MDVATDDGRRSYLCLNILPESADFLSAADKGFHISRCCYPDAAQLLGVESALTCQRGQVRLLEAIQGRSVRQGNKAIFATGLRCLGHSVALLYRNHDM